MEREVSFGSSEEFVEKELKSNALWAFLINVINAGLILLLLIILFKIPEVILRENIVKTIVDSLNISGLMSLEYSKIMYGLKGLVVLGSALYILIKMIKVGDKRILLEDEKIMYSLGGFPRSSRILRYSDIMRVRYNPLLFNVGKIILETYDVTKPITIDYVKPLKKNFEDVKEIITKNMTIEVSNKLKKVTNGKMEEESVNNVIGLLRRESVKKEDVVRTLVNVSKNKTTSDKKNIFKIVLLELVRTRRISKDTLKEVLQELKEKGLLTIDDIGDIVDLRFETEERYMEL